MEDILAPLTEAEVVTTPWHPGHSMTTGIYTEPTVMFFARCECGWRVASASAGLRNWNVQGHEANVERGNQ